MPDIRTFRTTTEIDSSIAKLKRRISDIEKLESDGVLYNDAHVRNTEHAVIDTVRDVFGGHSRQDGRHSQFKIDYETRYAGGSRGIRYGGEFVLTVSGAVTRIQGLIDWLEEKRLELASPEVAPRVAFEGRSFNPAIGDASRDLYRDGHYAQAVFEAGKALIDLVRTKCGIALDGAPLMQHVFSVKNPILAFNTLEDQSDRDEQQGMMQLFVGAVLAIRNPGGHRVGIIEQPDRALQHLELLSYLADRLEETTKSGERHDESPGRNA